MDQHTLFRFGIMGAGNIASHFCKAVLFPKEREPVYFEDTMTSHGFVYEITETMDCIRNAKTESAIVPHNLTLRCSKLMDHIWEVHIKQ